MKHSKENSRRYYIKNRDKELIRNRKKYHDNKEHYKKYREKNKERHRAYIIKKQYGISFQEYQNILRKQKFCCSICKKRMDVCHIDHNHTTGKVRGILCRTCNLGIGYFFDNPEILKSATQYIQDNSSILLTGAYGILGTELRKSNLKFIFYKKEEFDFTNLDQCKKFLKGVSLIVHAGAFTDLVKAEREKQICYETNVIGTRNLASFGIPMLYISTEYIFEGEKGSYEENDYPNPQNFYAFTKLLGEYESRRTRSVVVRCLFKPRPFEHESACVDQFTSGDYVDSIASGLAIAIKRYDQLPSTIHIGTGRKSTFELASRTRSVKQCSIEDIKTVKLPRDTSLNTSLWERIKNG